MARFDHRRVFLLSLRPIATSEELLLDSAQTFAEACVQEMGNPEILSYMDTQQAIQDLDLFRQLTGEQQFWLWT